MLCSGFALQLALQGTSGMTGTAEPIEHSLPQVAVTGLCYRKPRSVADICPL